MDDLDQLGELNDLDRALATVNSALSARPDPTDLSDPEALTLLSDRGLLRRDRYRVAGDPADLDRAIADLTAASPATHHPDWPLWCYELGSAHLVRMARVAAEATDDAALLPELLTMMEQGITWLERAYSADHPDVDRHEVANDLAELHRQLYANQRTEADRLPRCDRLILTLHELRVPAEDERRHRIWQMHLGAAYEDRFGLTSSRADLDLAIRYLSSTVDTLAMDVLLLPDAYQCLARAYQAHHDLTDDEASLDRLIAVAGRGVDRTAHDPAAQRYLRWTLFQALRQRYQRTGSDLDRDRAIEIMRKVLADDGDAVDPEDAADLATLLFERGRERRCEDDLLAAAAWYGVAADHTPDDDELKWLLHLQTADSYQAHRMISESVTYLVPLMEALTAALTLGVPDPHLRLAAHGQRVQAFDAFCDHRLIG